MALLSAGAAAPRAGGDAPAFVVRIVAPDPLHLAGVTSIEAAAFDPSGAPYPGIAWMSLSLDGAPPEHDDRPPWSWTVDAGAAPRGHRIAVVAVGRDGSKASLSTLSTPARWVDAVTVSQVLVPVVVRAEPSRGTPERLVTDLQAGDFTILEDGAVRPIVSFSSEPPAGAIALAFDTSLSMEPHLWSARKAALDFVASRPAPSNLSLLTFNDDVYLEQDFTTDRSAVGAALAAARAGGSRTALYETLRVGSRHLAKQAGPRTLVIFTDGMDTRDEDDGRLRTAIEAAQGADVAIYGIAWGTEASASLARMALGTGGEVYGARSAGELRGAFAAIGEALGSRYLLGFEPSTPERAGYRRIEVRVARQGVRVHARAGYHAAPARGSGASR
jgi:VWFA-related protein